MTATATKSKPAQLADDIEAAGWKVERRKDGARRGVRAVHHSGRVLIVEFERRMIGAAARDVFVSADAFEGTERIELGSVEHARKWLRAVPGPPFDPETALDADVLAAVAGRCIEWRNSISGDLEYATVPRGGMHLKLVSDPLSKALGRRVLTFASADGAGFRSVRLSAIEKVS